MIFAVVLAFFTFAVLPAPLNPFAKLIAQARALLACLPLLFAGEEFAVRAFLDLARRIHALLFLNAAALLEFFRRSAYQGMLMTIMAQDVFAGLSRGVPGLTPRQMTAPASEFESPAAIAAAQSLRYAPHKFILGLVGARIEIDPDTGQRYAEGGRLVAAEDDRHAITIAGSRAGKSRAAIIPNMLSYAGSVLAIDPKGELALNTAPVRAKTQRVHVLDPFGTTGGQLPEGFYSGFNPLEFMSPESAIEDAALIADGRRTDRRAPAVCRYRCRPADVPDRRVSPAGVSEPAGRSGRRRQR